MRVLLERPGPLVLALAVMLASACRKESDRPKWDVDLLFPLVTTSLTIGDLVADSLLVVDPDGGVSLLYRSELFAVSLDSVLVASDTTFFYPGVIPVPGPLNLPPGFGIVSDNDVTSFDFDGVELRHLELREGQVTLRIVNMIQSIVLAAFQLPSATFPGGNGTLNASVGPGTPSAPTSITQMRDLSGVTLDLRGPNLNSVNTLQTIVAIDLDPAGSGATVTDQDSVNALVTYSGLVPQYARGYFGSRTIEVEPTDSDLGLFDNIVSGTLDLDAVTLRVRIENGIGMDIQVVMKELVSVNSRTGATVDLTHTLLEGPINLARAQDVNGMVQPFIYERVMDEQDSNVDLFIENLPDRLSYAMDLRLNPLGDISNGHDFAYHDSKLKADIELEVPLRLIANELTLRTHTKVDLPGSEDGHGLQSADLKIFATNGFPFSARLELAIVNANDEVLAHLPVQGTVATGILGGDGFVQQAVPSQLTTRLEPPHVDLLYGENRLRIQAVFNTADQSQHLQLLSSYRLDLQVTLGANYIVNGDE
ncbi:MAG: hypothetical protein KIT10_02875 [Flavobacteriales bacterium]|nr:hypothetical protein [Flavobacteriales bacterium]